VNAGVSLNEPPVRYESDSELRFLAGISRMLPPFRGAGRIATAMRALYRRRKRPLVQADVLGAKMILDPHEYVDSSLLFFPQLYDHREIRFLKERLKPGQVFLDAGTNIGFYSLVCAKCVGPSGRVVAVEADPEIVARIKEHVALNTLTNVSVCHVGLSDKEETLRLGINHSGNRGSTSFLADDQPDSVMVPCKPLGKLLEELKIPQVHYAKFDIEGFGVKVIRQYFDSIPDERLPLGLIAEKEEGIIPVLTSRGYKVVSESSFNLVCERG
jgi:FkbM family methyltransferase